MVHPSSTPLPLRPIFALVLGRVAEGATWSVILPYINNQLDSLGIAPSLVGTYSGAAESILMITESLVAPLWAKGSDKWGRKRLYLMGLGCHSVFGIIYGFSDHVWQILFWRLMLGTMAGCGVLSRTLLAEVCDSTNVVRGFGLFSPAITLGVSLGAYIGGAFSNPAQRISILGDVWILSRWPYLLPNVIVGLIGLAGTFYGSRTLTETLDQSHASPPLPGMKAKRRPSGLRDLLQDRTFVLLLVLYGAQQAAAFGTELLLPLVLYTPLALGGLGQSTAAIGNIVGLSSLLGIVMTLTLFPWLASRMNKSTFLRVSAWSYFACVILYPAIIAAGYSGWKADGGRESREQSVSLSSATWLLLALHIFLKRFADFSQSLLDAMVPAAIPHPSALASANSLTFSVGGIGRAIGPFLFGSIFGFSTGGAPFGPRRSVIWLFTSGLCVVTGSASMRFKPHDDGVLGAPNTLDSSNGRAHDYELVTREIVE